MTDVNHREERLLSWLKFVSDPEGKAVMDYLKSITVNQVASPPFDALYLAYQEGRRSIVAEMQSMAAEAITISEKRAKPNDGRDINRRINSDDSFRGKLRTRIQA
ncbi:MAG: Bbp19 family protein [Rhodospirillales bacterium]